MIPATVSLETKSEAEKALFSQLHDLLDDSHTVFHSYDVLQRNLDNNFIDAEIDFLIFSPKAGLLTLEVKGGSIRYDGTTGTWLQNGKPLKESPYHQAKKNKYAVAGFLKKKTAKRILVVIGHAVCFPDVYRLTNDLPADADSAITLTGKTIPYISEFLPNILQKFRKDSHGDLKKQEAEIIRKALMPEFEYGASLADMIGTAEKKIFKLTEKQCDLLDFLGDRRHVLIKGGAGTGKTIMAMKKAREFALAGKKVLLLCFNKPLGQVLEKSAKEIQGDITAINYHAFCIQKLRDDGIDISLGTLFNLLTY